MDRNAAIEHMAISEIARLLETDGYEARLAVLVKMAAQNGTLSWTEQRLRVGNFDFKPSRTDEQGEGEKKRPDEVDLY
jgi:hypothetical protein